MSQIAASPDLGALQEDFEGRILVPDDAAYEQARTIFNAMIDRRPRVIAQCASRDDVAAAIAFARREGLEIAVRGGGHSVAGACLSDGGIVIDMRNMNAVSVDPDARTATVEGGALWGDLDRACQPHRLATTGGRVSTTGVAGLTLGGGSGWLERKWGLACDNLLSVELITAGGERVRAAENENPELFWALHGGGGNFGAATELVFRLHELPAATLGLLLWSPERGAEITRLYRDLIEGGAPLELGGGIFYLTGPGEEEFVPDRLRGRLTCAVVVTYAGDEAETREAIAPLLELEPEGSFIAEMPYEELQCALDDPPGFRNYWSAEHLASLPDEAVEAFCARADSMVVPSPSQHVLIPWGGEVAAAAERYPLPHRRAEWVMHPFGLWDDPADDERAIAWAREGCADLRSHATGDVYLNFIGDEGRDRVIAGFGRDNYERLAAVKASYDPNNVFRLNHNIEPEVSTNGG